METERLNKYLAECGICSRRDADRLIEEGRVTVNGIKADVGMRVLSSDIVEVNGKQLKGKNDKVVLAYYKPVGITCTEKDKFADKKIFDVVKFPIRLTYAGRLDKESEGLILLTNDGDLIDALMRGASCHEKEYIVKVNKEITDSFITNMSAGLYLKEINVKTKPCRVEKIGKFTFKIILTEGVNRQIRRMCLTQNYRVVQLKRIRVGNIQLANLKIGEFRQIQGIELQSLYNLAYNRK